MTAFKNLRSSDALWSFATPRFVVEFHAIDEDLNPADSFECVEDVEFARSGDPAAWFCAVMLVRVNPSVEDYRYHGDASGEIIGVDTLGGCSYRSFAEFRGQRTGWKAGARIVTGHYFPDMVREAIGDARRTLAAQAQRAAKIHA